MNYFMNDVLGKTREETKDYLIQEYKLEEEEAEEFIAQYWDNV